MKPTILHWHIPGSPDDQKPWRNGEATRGAVDILLDGEKAIVAPTKVGYIVITTDSGGLKKKFLLKNRPESKPGVVLCKDNLHMEQLAQTTEKIRQLYALAQERDILLGCILPWQKQPFQELIPENCKTMVSDLRDTSCFVIRFGQPSEVIVDIMWKDYKQLCFASSANPSGQGNRGELSGVGERILDGVDLVIEGDKFVAAQQPQASAETRMEQGVMVSFVDAKGVLSDNPMIIRHGLQLEEIKGLLIEVFGDFVDSHGSYH